MASAVIAVLWAWSVWFIARRAGAGPFAILAGLLVAVPPVFLSHAQLSTHGESSALAFGTLAMASAVYLVDARAPGRRGAAWAVLGHGVGPELVVEPDRRHGAARRRRARRRSAAASSAAPGPTWPSRCSSSPAGPSGYGTAPRVGHVPAPGDVGRAAAAVEHPVQDRRERRCSRACATTSGTGGR